MGEFECRHYATVCNDRDVSTAVDSPQMDAVFRLSERFQVPFLLHHEAEDVLLPALERMLERHPRARVIWCHGGRNRNATHLEGHGPCVAGARAPAAASQPVL